MKKYLLILLATTLTLPGFAAEKPAYILYDQDGKEVKYSKMVKDLEDADIIFFGELHTDPIAHWMQLELTKELFAQKKEALVLGAEMFEADNQMILNEYLDSLYPADKFEAEMRLWNNYQTDYKPVVEFAKEHQIPYIATIFPAVMPPWFTREALRRWNRSLMRPKDSLPPFPILYDPEVKCYKDMLDMGTEKAPRGNEKRHNRDGGSHGNACCTWQGHTQHGHGEPAQGSGCQGCHHGPFHPGELVSRKMHVPF